MEAPIIEKVELAMYMGDGPRPLRAVFLRDRTLLKNTGPGRPQGARPALF
jgi:hypothetical protein